MDRHLGNPMLYVGLPGARAPQRNMERFNNGFLQRPTTTVTVQRVTPAPKNDGGIPILKGFQQKIPIEAYLTKLESLKGCQALVFGPVPLHSIHFKNLQLNGIEQALLKSSGDLKRGLSSFKNYLLWKKSGHGEALISVFPGMSASDKLEYSLQIDREFLRKLQLYLPDPSVKIQLVVEGIRQLHMPNVHTGNGENVVFEFAQVEGINLNQFYFVGEAKVSMLLQADNSMIHLKNKKESLELTRTQLLVQTDPSRNLIFNWSVEIEVGEALENKKEFKIRSDLILQRIYEEESKEVTIIAANGAEIKCHKNILVAQSESFHSMFFPEYEMMEVQTGKIEMKENSEEGLCLFVKLLYGFPLPVETVTCEMAVELFQLANKYGVKELEGSLMDFLCLKDMQFFNADTILELYLITRNVECLEELKAHALLEMSKLTEETLTGCKYFKKLPRDDAVNLLFTLLQWKN